MKFFRGDNVIPYSFDLAHHKNRPKIGSKKTTKRKESPSLPLSELEESNSSSLNSSEARVLASIIYNVEAPLSWCINGSSPPKGKKIVLCNCHQQSWCIMCSTSLAPSQPPSLPYATTGDWDLTVNHQDLTRFNLSYPKPIHFPSWFPSLYRQPSAIMATAMAFTRGWTSNGCIAEMFTSLHPWFDYKAFFPVLFFLISFSFPPDSTAYSPLPWSLPHHYQALI